MFYESPRRLGETLGAMAVAFGAERPAVVALELTKKFERVARREPLAELATQFADAETKGEAVILVAGAAEGDRRSGRVAGGARRGDGRPAAARCGR